MLKYHNTSVMCVVAVLTVDKNALKLTHVVRYCERKILEKHCRASRFQNFLIRIRDDQFHVQVILSDHFSKGTENNNKKHFKLYLLCIKYKK